MTSKNIIAAAKTIMDFCFKLNLFRNVNKRYKPINSVKTSATAMIFSIDMFSIFVCIYDCLENEIIDKIRKDRKYSDIIITDNMRIILLNQNSRHVIAIDFFPDFFTG